MDDESLMLATASGDREAYEKLYNSHFRPLRGYLNRRLRDRELAEDLAQDTFTRIWQFREKFVSGSNFRSWMYRIAERIVIDSIRREKAMVHGCQLDDETDSLIVDSKATSPAVIAERQEMAWVCIQAMSQVLPDQRDATMEFANGSTFTEIAARFDIGIPTAKSRHRLALEKVRQIVGVS